MGLGHDQDDVVDIASHVLRHGSCELGLDIVQTRLCLQGDLYARDSSHRVPSPSIDPLSVRLGDPSYRHLHGPSPGRRESLPDALQKCDMSDVTDRRTLREAPDRETKASRGQDTGQHHDVNVADAPMLEATDLSLRATDGTGHSTLAEATSQPRDPHLLADPQQVVMGPPCRPVDGPVTRGHGIHAGSSRLSGTYLQWLDHRVRSDGSMAVRGFIHGAFVLAAGAKRRAPNDSDQGAQRRFNAHRTSGGRRGVSIRRLSGHDTRALHGCLPGRAAASSAV